MFFIVTRAKRSIVKLYWIGLYYIILYRLMEYNNNNNNCIQDMQECIVLYCIECNNNNNNNNNCMYALNATIIVLYAWNDGIVIIMILKWSFRRFTYGNLVTTFTFSKWPSSRVFVYINNDKETLGPSYQAIQSIVATGGVYKGQGRNRFKIMTWIY